jgi:Leucine-rich repeat (LRR) protein
LGVSYLAALPNLRHLELRYCALDDLAVMATLSNLETLNIRGNVSQLILEPLADAKRLTTLNVSDCALASLRGLNQMASLDVLSVVSCRLEHDEAIVDLIPSQLTSLTLSMMLSAGNLDVMVSHRWWANIIKQLKNLHPWMEIS